MLTFINFVGKDVWRRLIDENALRGISGKWRHHFPMAEKKTRSSLLTSPDTPPIDHAPVLRSSLRAGIVHIYVHGKRNIPVTDYRLFAPAVVYIKHEFWIKAEDAPFGCVPVIILIIIRCASAWNERCTYCSSTIPARLLFLDKNLQDGCIFFCCLTGLILWRHGCSENNAVI